jgi:hypothetical protein
MAEPAKEWNPSPEELESLGLVDQDGAAENAFARVLVLGPAKAGKTTCLASTAPRPFIINCDGMSATKGPKELGARFLVAEATTRATWRRACQTALKLADEGKIGTIIVDTLTLLSDNLLDEISVTLDGFDRWNELAKQLVGGIKSLTAANAHLFVVCHMTPDHDTAAGILPAIPGNAKIRIPGILDDWILLDVEPGRKPHERMWLLGPQKGWNHSGRNIRRSSAVEATVPALLKELDINL